MDAESSSQFQKRGTAGVRVLVVGAGLAGLGAGWRLARRGFEVKVLESGERAGGRFAGTRVEGFSIDRSPPLLSSGDRSLLGWMAELNLGDRMLPLRPAELAQVHRGELACVDPGSLLGVARIAGVRWRDALRAARLPRLFRRYRRLLDPRAPERAVRWDDRSLADFARLYFGRSGLDRWIAPMVTSTHLGDENELSRVTFLLQWLAWGEGRAALGLPRAPLHELPDSLVDRLGVRLRTRVERVEPGAGALVAHTRRGEGESQSLEVDAVVIATAAGEAARIAAPLLSPPERDFLMDLGYGPSIALSLALDRPLSAVPQQVWVPHLEGSPIESVLLDPGWADGIGRAPAGCGLVTATATERFGRSHAGAENEVVAKTLRAAVESLHPRAASQVRFSRLERATRSIPQFQVGSYRRLARFARVQSDRRSQGRRIYFAGDYRVGPRAEDGLVSGLRAAADLALDFA
jgi:protoporphyrinogen oxidase